MPPRTVKTEYVIDLPVEYRLPRDTACRLLAVWLADLSLAELRELSDALQDEVRKREEGVEPCLAEKT